jgi:DNA-directed RNA polymerase I, II, and III subunit RPABC2
MSNVDDSSSDSDTYSITSTDDSGDEYSNGGDNNSFSNENDYNSEDEEIVSDDDELFQKIKSPDNDYYIKYLHSECITHNFTEVKMLSIITRDKNNNIIDDLHKTMPILTKYEKTRILGQRATQIDQGSQPFIPIPLNIITGYDIAVEELKQKKLPFIIKRPLPNGSCEYWNISDLEILQ